MVDELLFFVYGSLRPGEYNSDRFGEELRVYSKDCLSRGSLWSVGPYPAAVFGGDDASWIHGDILVVNPDSKHWRMITNMETGADYVPTMVDVELPSGKTVVCMAWHWPWDTEDLEYIRGGDWVIYRKEQEDARRQNTTGS